MIYSGCKLAIKKFLRNSCFEFCNSNVINLTACLQKLSETNKGCKSYYDVLNQNETKPNCCSKWEDKLQRHIPWQSCFHQLSKIYDVNIKWFQMRIMHRLTGTNVVLKEMGVTINNRCSFCLTAKDTIKHIFWECRHSQQFWTRFLVLLKENVLLSLSECLILFGIDDSVKTKTLFDFLLLLAKQCLYKCKIEKQFPSIGIFRGKKMLYKIQNRGIQC